MELSALIAPKSLHVPRGILTAITDIDAPVPQPKVLDHHAQLKI
jgi:hypothetical protein